MGLVEGSFEVFGVSWYAEVVGLAPVAQGEARLQVDGARAALELGARLRGEGGHDRLTRGLVELSSRAEHGPGPVGGRVGPRHPGGGEHPGGQREERARHAERAGQVGPGQPAAAAEGDQGVSRGSRPRCMVITPSARRMDAFAVATTARAALTPSVPRRSPRASKARSAAATSRLSAPPRNPRSSGAWGIRPRTT